MKRNHEYKPDASSLSLSFFRNAPAEPRFFLIFVKSSSSGAFFIEAHVGNHKSSQQLSPKNMKPASQARIVDITKADEYRKYLYRCIVGPPSKQCKNRMEYLKKAIPKGFRKKLLLLNEQVVGQIEYSPATVSYYPIIGDNVARAPNAENAKPPTWNKQKLLEGTTSCAAHPLYHPQTYGPREILQKQ